MIQVLICVVIVLLGAWTFDHYRQKKRIDQCERALRLSKR